MLLSCCALGLSHATAGLAARFCRPYLVAAERTRWADERVRAHYRRLDGRMIEPDGSFPLVAALLERGSLVTVPFDMPPARRRPAPVSGAAARLAMATGALVVPAAATRR